MLEKSLERLQVSKHRKEATKEITTFLDEFAELYVLPSSKGSKQLRHLAEKGRGFEKERKRKLELVLKLLDILDNISRKRSERSLENNKSSEVEDIYALFTLWKKALSILHRCKSMLKLQNQSDLEKYSYNFTVHCLNNGLWDMALEQCCHSLYRFSFLLTSTRQSCENHETEKELVALVKPLRDAVKTTIVNEMDQNFILILLSSLRALRKCVEQHSLEPMSKCTTDLPLTKTCVYSVLQVIIEIWSYCCLDDRYRSIIQKTNNSIATTRKEVFNIFKRFILYDTLENLEERNVISELYHLYWSLLSMSLSKHCQLQEPLSWFSEWMSLFHHLIKTSNSQGQSLILKIFHKIQLEKSFQRDISDTININDWFPRVDSDLSINDWLCISTIIEAFFHSIGVEKLAVIEQARQEILTLFIKSAPQDILSTIDALLEMPSVSYVHAWSLSCWILNCGAVYGQEFSLFQVLLSSFLKCCKWLDLESSISKSSEMDMQNLLYDITTVVMKIVSSDNNETNAASLYSLLDPVFDVLERILRVNNAFSSKFGRNMATLYHNVSAVLAQKNQQYMLLSALYMRSSIEWRAIVQQDIQDHLSRLGMLIKMTQLFTCHKSFNVNMIPCVLLKAFSLCLGWCEKKQIELHKVLNDEILRRFAAETSSDAMKMFLLLVRTSHWEKDDGVIPHWESTAIVERSCIFILKNQCPDASFQWWLEMELQRLRFYSSKIEEAINKEEVLEQWEARCMEQRTCDVNDCLLQMIHYGWKSLIRFVQQPQCILRDFWSDDAYHIWNQVLKSNTKNVNACILIHLLEVFQWSSEFFMITQANAQLWQTVLMICQFLRKFQQHCHIRLENIRKYVVWIATVALGNFFLYEEAIKLLRQYCSLDHEGYIEWILLLRHLEIHLYEEGRISSITHLDISQHDGCSRRLQSLYKVQNSKILWQQGNIKESYDDALEAVKLYLSLLYQITKNNQQTIEFPSERNHCNLNLAGTSIEVDTDKVSVGFFKMLVDAVESFHWLGKVCERFGCIAEAEYYWQCCIDVIRIVRSHPLLLKIETDLMSLHKKARQTEKFSQCLESFQAHLKQLEHFYGESFHLSRFALSLMHCFDWKGSSVCYHIETNSGLFDSSINHENLVQAQLKQHLVGHESQLPFSGMPSAIISRFLHPHDYAVNAYYVAENELYHQLGTTFMSSLWNLTRSCQLPDTISSEHVEYICSLIRKVEVIIAKNPLPWLERKLYLLRADIERMKTSEPLASLCYLYKANGLEYYYQYRAFQSHGSSALLGLEQPLSNDVDISSLSANIERNLHITINEHDGLSEYNPFNNFALLHNLPKEWSMVGMTPDITGKYIFLWYREGSVQILQRPVLLKIAIKNSSIWPQSHEGNILESILQHFRDIIQESHDQASTNCKKKLSYEEKSVWWEQRHCLDAKLGQYMQVLEDSLLGVWKVLLVNVQPLSKLMHSQCQSAYEQLQVISGDDWPIHWELFQALFKRRSLLEKWQDWLFLVKQLVDWDYRSTARQQSLAHGIEEYAKKWWYSLDSKRQKNKTLKREEQQDSLPRDTMLLILDDSLLQLPIESLPFLQYWQQPMTRMNGLLLTNNLWQQRKTNWKEQRHSFLPHFIEPTNGFFLLNPAGDLNSTQEAFQDLFRDVYHWNGYTGPIDTVSGMDSNSFVQELSKHDLFLYCGHGTGEKYFPCKRIRKLTRVPVTLLMGCSSGRPCPQGVYSPWVSCFSFLHAQAVVVNLWDVTDRDIDRFTKVLLEEWFENLNKDLAHAVLCARQSCQFPYLTGCAPVVYGLPHIFIRPMPH